MGFWLVALTKYLISPLFFRLLIPRHLFRSALLERAGSNRSFTRLAQTVVSSEQWHRGPCSSLYGIDFGSYTDTRSRTQTHHAHTQLPPPWGVALINELKVQRCLCVWSLYAGHFALTSIPPAWQADRGIVGKRHAFLFYFIFAVVLVYWCMCHVSRLHWLCARVCDTDRLSGPLCVWRPSPSLPRFISIYDQQKKKGTFSF